MFNQTKAVLLHDIYVISSDFTVSGCSSKLCQQSEVSIVDCKFLGIQGSFGAVMLISESNATFSGFNNFSNNTASYGGSLFLFKSSVSLNGTNWFTNNTSSKRGMHENDCRYIQTKNLPIRNSGSAIYCNSSNLSISDTIFHENFALQGKGGALSAESGVIIFQRTIILH